MANYFLPLNFQSSKKGIEYKWKIFKYKNIDYKTENTSFYAN